MFWSAEHTHTSKIACCFVDALRCVRAADQNMAAHNPPLTLRLSIFEKRVENWHWKVVSFSISIMYAFIVVKYIWLSSKERLFHTSVFFFSGEPACFPSLTFWTPSNCHRNYFCFMSRMFKLPRKCSRVTSENLVSPEKKTLLKQFCKIQIGLKQKPIYLKSVVLVSTPVVNLGSPLALNTSLQQVP